VTTRHLINSELVALLDQFPALQYTDETVGQMRAMIQAIRSQMLPTLPAFPGIAVSEHFVPGPEGAPAELHVYPGVYHAFNMATDAQVSQAAMRDQLAALKRVLLDPSSRSDKRL